MKKLFFIAAIAGAALVGCTKNELAPSVTAQEEISFAAPVVGVQTKVNGAIDADCDTGESFDVWCVYNTGDITTWGGTPYFSNVTASYETAAGGWTLNPKYYWPATGQLSFVALSPSFSNETTYSATNGFQITEWSQGATETAIVDLMYSDESLNNEKADFSADGEEKTGDANSYTGVDITFNHALSYLVFKIKTAGIYTPTQFRLNAITLSGIYTTGKFTQKASDPWEEKTDGTTGTYVAYTGGSLTFDDDPAVLVPETAQKEIILLPQKLVDGKQKLTINYQISTDGANWIAQVQEIDLSKGSITAWEMGKKYTYTLSISMTEIILDPAVAVWDTTGSGTLDL